MLLRFVVMVAIELAMLIVWNIFNIHDFFGCVSLSYVICCHSTYFYQV